METGWRSQVEFGAERKLLGQSNRWGCTAGSGCTDRADRRSPRRYPVRGWSMPRAVRAGRMHTTAAARTLGGDLPGDPT